MKKVLSIVLTLALVIGLMPTMAFANNAAYSDIAGAPCENAVTTLSGLGVVDGYPDGTYQPDNAVKRAEAAKLIISALGLSEEAAGTKASFTDLAGYEWAEGYIGYAEALGILQGDGNGKYRPGDTVNYNEMAAIVIRALGYTDNALQGTFPAAHVAKAKALGVFTDVTSGGSAGADRGDCAIMIFNVLGNPIGSVDKDGEWTANTPADSMVDRLGASIASTDEIVDLTDARNAVVDLYPYIGVQADLYENADGEIVAITNIDSTVLTGEFTSTTVFEADGVEYSVGAADEFDTIVNTSVANTAQTTGDITLNTEYTVAAEVSGKTLKDVHSVSTWTGVNIQWDKANIKEIAKSAPTFEGITLTLNDSKEIDTTLFTVVGADSLADIAEDAIVTYYTAANAGTDLVKVEVSTATVEGKVTKVASDGDVTIDGKEYPVAIVVALGADGTYYLNYAGEICVYEAAEGIENYGIVLAERGQDGTPGYGEDAVWKIKILTAAGEETIFVVDEDSLGNVASSGLAGELVIYELDSDNEITDVDVVGTTSATGDEYTPGYIDNQKISDDVIVFTGTSVSDYAVGSLESLPVEEALGTVSYYKDSTSGLVEVIINGDSTENTVYGYISAVADTYNDDDEAVKQVTLANGDVYLTTKTVTGSVVASASLVKLTLTDGVISDVAAHGLTVVTDYYGNQTVAGVDEGAISIPAASGYVKVNAAVEVYELVDGEVVEITYDELAEDDVIYIFDTNTSDKDGYDIIIIVG